MRQRGTGGRLDDASLLEALREMRPYGRSPRTVARGPNPYKGSQESEIVVCDPGTEAETSLFLKWGGSHEHRGHGFWNGTAHEACVYETLLHPLGVDRGIYLGRLPLLNPETAPCIVLRYLAGALRLHKAPRESLSVAGAWLGRFHAATERMTLEAPTVCRLPRYDAAYFRGWALRTARYAAGHSDAGSWSERVCRWFVTVAGELDHPTDRAIVHGEFYPSNILVHEGHVVPVDWQSTAVGAGVVDLASLLEGWGRGVLPESVIDTYVEARWEGTPPAGFERRLQLARIYWPLRWLGDVPEATALPRRGPYFALLREEAARLGATP